jgi:hypothetical protein
MQALRFRPGCRRGVAYPTTIMNRKINLVLFQPAHPRFAILAAYQEVIDSLHWGFDNLGYRCTSSVNTIDHSCTNIVFGWIVAFQIGGPRQFPEGTILYNLEQFSVGSMKGAEILEAAAARFQIWDYAAGNIKNWSELAPRFPVYLAPAAFAPNLLRLPPVARHDIDLGYVGSLNPKRMEKIIGCSSHFNRYSVLTISNVWGRLRDEFIARSKVLLNVSGETPSQTIFEIVRVSYYLANGKAVVCEARPGLEIEDDMRDVLRFVPSAELADACNELITDEQQRKHYAQAGHEAFLRRDVRDVIRGFFG